MRQTLERLAVETPGRGFTEITREVAAVVTAAGIRDGLATLFCRHTSASLLIQENADADVRRDLETFLARIAPEGEGRYIHEAEGPDDMPAHIRAALTATTLGIPISSGMPVLGTWQGIYLYEHRRMPHRREVVVHVIGD